MKLVESILTKNPCYTAGKKIAVKGLMLHSVGCSQPSAAVFIRNWNKESYDRACVHGFIDANDGTVYQTLPWDHRGWHCGSGTKGSANNTHIGVEMCEPACIKYTGNGAAFTCSDLETARAAAKRTYEAAVELYATLCERYSLDPLADGVVISHKEGHTIGVASNHGDPEHLWTQLGLEYTMDTFRKAVKEKIAGKDATPPAAGPVSTVHPDKLSYGYYRVRKTWTDSKSQLGAYKYLKYAKAKADANPGYFVFDPNGAAFYPSAAPAVATPAASSVSVPFLVKVSITDLNIRKGPGTDYGRTGKFTGVGVFTILEVRTGKGATAGWGRLKSGAGWISLDYAKKL